MSDTQQPGHRPEPYVSRVLLLRADTPVHVGSGSTLAVIDLPINREALTQLPIFPGTGLKGAWRQKAREVTGTGRMGANGLREDLDPRLLDLFGPESENASSYAGAMSVGEARVLCFPVRSIKGLFAWVSSPTALSRLRRDLPAGPLANATEALLKALDTSKVNRTADTEEAYAAVAGDGLVMSGQARGSEAASKRVIFEEFSFEVDGSFDSKALKTFASCLAGYLNADGGADRLKDRIVVLDDDTFRHFCVTATEVNAHVALDPETKTAEEGKLFYVEDLPAETILYSRLTFMPQRRPKSKDNDAKRSAADMDATFGALLMDNDNALRFQIGGHETTGRGRITAYFAD